MKQPVGYALVANACVVAVVLALTGCGGDESLTKAEVIQQGTSICKAAEAKAKAAPQPPDSAYGKNPTKGDLRALAKFYGVFASGLAGVHSQFEGFALPGEDKAELQAFIDEAGTAADKFGQASEAAASGDAQAASAALREAFRTFGEAGKHAKAYGFPHGVCSPGE